VKGIILAGGTGSRLYPMTRVVSKQLLPVYDKPMVYYPLSMLLLAGIRDILLVSTPVDTPRFEYLLGDGANFGVSISYAVQPTPGGPAQAFLIGESFIGNDACALILGDNIFYGTDLQSKMTRAVNRTTGATIFAYPVRDPRRYGVVELDRDERPVALVEKPERPGAGYAVTGLYFYDADVTCLARELEPSPRGELEITELNQRYLDRGQLHAEVLGRGTAWLDTGTQSALLDAANFLEMIEKMQGFKLCCPEEVAYRMGFISPEDLERIAAPLVDSGYGQYLLDILRDRKVHDS